LAQQNDPWTEVLDRWVPDEPTGKIRPPRRERTVRLTTARIVIGSLLGAIVLAVAIAGGILTFVNDARADRWQTRSEALQKLVDDRTTALNRQTTRLNTSAATLRKAQTALTRSEKDVAGLQKRQEELANEKAQLEDERAQLRHVAGLLQQCNAGVRGILDALAEGSDPEATVDVAQVGAACEQADSSVTTVSTGE